MAKVIKQFSWAHRGVEVKEYAEGDLDTDAIDQPDVAEMLQVAETEGWIGAEADQAERPKRGRKPAENKAHDAAPEQA